MAAAHVGHNVQIQERHQKRQLFTWLRYFSLVMPGRILLFYSLHFPLGYNIPNVPKVHLGVYQSIKLCMWYSVLVSSGCHNKIPETERLKQHTYFLTVLETGGPRS